MLSRLFYDFAVYFAGACCGVCLIGVNVHSQSIFGAHTDYYVAEHQASAVGIDLHGYNIFVFHAQFLRIFRSCMDMTLCGDHAFLYFHFSCRSNQLTCAGACHIAGLTDRSDYADGTCVGQRQLNLGLRTYRSEDRGGEFLLASYDLYFLVAGKLTRLRQVFFLGQLIALAEQSLQILLSYMYVS